jgi:pimeloyl-ACP methyl ester carboxylesterase
VTSPSSATRSGVGRFVLVDAVGIEVEGHPIIDFFSLTPRQIAEASYHDPDRFGIDPTTLPPEAQKAMAANRAALTSYSGQAMSDPTLVGRLAAVTRPVLVLWGDADRIVDADYGRAWARAILGAKFDLLTETGHLPQIESPRKLLDAIWTFASGGE